MGSKRKKIQTESMIKSKIVTEEIVRALLKEREIITTAVVETVTGTVGEIRHLKA